MGDDVNDLPLLRPGGPLGGAGRRAPRGAARRSTSWPAAPGGRGAVRELCDLILEARGG